MCTVKMGGSTVVFIHSVFFIGIGRLTVPNIMPWKMQSYLHKFNKLMLFSQEQSFSGIHYDMKSDLV